jgi:hypothetical protein
VTAASLLYQAAVKILKIPAAVAGAVYLGIAIHNAKPLKCISYLEDWCIKAVPDR